MGNSGMLLNTEPLTVGLDAPPEPDTVYVEGGWVHAMPTVPLDRGVEAIARFARRSWERCIEVQLAALETDRKLAIAEDALKHLATVRPGRDVAAALAAVTEARSHTAAAEPAHHQVGPLAIDTDLCRVTIGTERVALTPLEYRFLLYLAEATDRVVPRDELLEHVWGPQYLGNSCADSLSVVLGHLRRKIERDPAHTLLHTQRGIGIRLAVDDDATAA